MATKTTRVFQMLLQLEVHSLNSNGDASSTSGVLSMTELTKMYGFLYSGSKPPSWTKPDGRSRSDSPPTLFCQRLRVRFIEWVAALGHGVAWSVADDVQLEQPTDGALVNELSDYRVHLLFLHYRIRRWGKRLTLRCRRDSGGGYWETVRNTRVEKEDELRVSFYNS